MESLVNKNILVVGATGGIGSETVRLLRSSRANVMVAGRDENRLRSLASANDIPLHQAFAMDLTDAGSIERTAATIHHQFGQLDILINAAGIGILKPIETLGIGEFDQVLNVNLRGPFLLLKHFLPPMKAVRKGLIIHIPGVLGKAPMAGAGAYAASKFGLNGLLQSVREEVKRTEIRFTSLYLGGTDTGFWDSIDLKVQREKMVQAREAAKAIWFLCQQPLSGVVSEMVVQPFNHQVL